jgi:hypothetical protein
VQKSRKCRVTLAFYGSLYFWCVTTASLRFCRYGGGDDICFSRVILTTGLPSSQIPSALRKQVVTAARAAIDKFRPAPPTLYHGYQDEPPIARLNFGLELDDDGSQLSWDLKFTILSHVRCVSAPFPFSAGLFPPNDRFMVPVM